MLTAKQLFYKRFFDVVLAFLLLVVFFIPIVILILLATISTQQNGWYSQKRVGYQGNLFCLYKIRTLKGINHKDINAIKAAETPLGSWLRKTKLDEFPQLLNVLKGDMSFVGPRPDIPGYADVLKGEDRKLLAIRPGITGPATLLYKNEDQLLIQQPHPLHYNDTVIWPDKVAINLEYIKNWSFKKDLKYLWQSVVGSAKRES